MSFAYGIPIRQLKRQLTSAEYTELIAAARLGMVPRHDMGASQDSEPADWDAIYRARKGGL